MCKRVMAFASIAIGFLGLSPSAPAQQSNMTFFVTSVGVGKGADLGGLPAPIATASSSRKRRARAANLARLPEHAGRRRRRRRQRARPHRPRAVAERQGRGHRRQTSTSCTATTSSPRRPRSPKRAAWSTAAATRPNMHDVLTGSQPDGTAFTAAEDQTCGNWTKSGTRRGDARPHRPARHAR